MSAPAPERSRAGRTCLVIGSFVLIVGLVVAIAGIVRFVNRVGRPLVDSLSSEVYRTPVNATLNLDSGRFLVMQLVPTAVPNAPLPPDAIQLAAGDIEVDGPNGTQVTVDSRSGGFMLTRDSDVYVDVAAFTAEEKGRYQLRVDASSDLRVTVVPDVITHLQHAASSLIYIGIGGFAGLVGVVLLIVGGVLVYRSRHPKPAYGAMPGYGTPVLPGGFPYTGSPPGPPGPPGGSPTGPAAGPPPQALPPPGWYPDPARPGASRWWDGRNWTP